MDDLERQYLRTAYELATKDPRRAFHKDEIAARFDLGYGPDSDEDLVATITRDLIERGYIESGGNSTYVGGGVTLKLTRAGKDEAERLADPIEQRKELRRDFLRAVYEQADGSPTEYVYWPNLAPRFRYADMQMPPNSIEVIADQLAGMGFITIEVDEGGIYRITAKGVDEVEGNKPQPQQNVSNVFNMSGTFYQAAVGTHNTNTFSGDLDFSTVEQRIEEEGGADKEDLRELVREMRELLESGQTLDKGRLARFNDKLKEVPWLAGPVAGWLLNFATQEIPQHLPPHLG
jgi:DNA-binding PadR family transcriptional regulator